MAVLSLQFLQIPPFSSLKITLTSLSKPRIGVSLSSGWLMEKTTFGVSSMAGLFLVRCRSEEREAIGEPGIKELLSGMVDKRVEELLNKEENKEILGDLEEAIRRVDDAKMELKIIEKQQRETQEMKAYIRKMEERSLEIAECQRDLLAAKVMVEEAERSLSQSIDGLNSGNELLEGEIDEMDRERERLESVKASLVSSFVGLIASLPVSFSRPVSGLQLSLHLAFAFVGCALFGVTFRYAVRRDLDNIQLKTGTVTAFGLIKGLAGLEAGLPPNFDGEKLWSLAYEGALLVSENIFIFLFASIALDFCFKTSLLSPFPIQKRLSGADLTSDL
ncbi:uncharacterized protein LOC18438957 [Amborella trichopoda]|uniref:Uncharacterized protein n=1 Tax=Amborella trichopoda TaxID=13333 RepID=W1PU10_AMBTC|nr:uncharacterized protein LOC18438957 [Amborella trichopoda]ERN10775.1 hypothetical protein AMTR_s00027p00217000 [Amborella trichopoda]|eukprot:XP_006849194.1 uncharacterized protein LOC18438957 [Amborella trichopoda]